MRWLVLTVCICAELLLLAIWFAHGLGAGLPFATSYSPHDYGSFIALGMLLVALGAIVASQLRGASAIVASWLAAGALVASLVAYAAYHASHPMTFASDGWEGTTQVIPYHQQLALPCIITLVAIAAMFASAVPMPVARFRRA